jgi:peptide/nickel transport system ATP-binding protein
MTDNSVLSANDVVVEYRGRPPLRAVDGVSFDVAPAEVVALVGESGCGKSSLARAVIGIEKRVAGGVRFGDTEVPVLGIRRRPTEFTGMQMVFQDPNSSLNPRRRVGDQIADGVRAAVRRGEKGSDPADWLERVGLEREATRRYPHEFSGGQKQRIAIARALAARPRMLVADEPISALDASTQTSVAALMRALSIEAGAGMLFISHDLSVVRGIADRTLVM